MTQPPPLPQQPPLAVPMLNYAGPMLEPVPADQQVVWRDGKVLVARKLLVLPPLCIKCNGPAEGEPLRRRLRWHHPGFYLLIPAGLLLYAIVATVLQQHGTIALSLCAKHRQRRLLIGLSAAGLAVGGLAMLILTAHLQQTWLALTSIGIFLGGIVLGVSNQVVTPKKIDEHFVWVRGCCEPFLANFPPVGRA
jgi:hypothetical protein